MLILNLKAKLMRIRMNTPHVDVSSRGVACAGVPLHAGGCGEGGVGGGGGGPDPQDGLVSG